jgi:hypothetical protein
MTADEEASDAPVVSLHVIANVRTEDAMHLHVGH